MEQTIQIMALTQLPIMVAIPTLSSRLKTGEKKKKNSLKNIVCCQVLLKKLV
jgi:hypothetical protein